MDVSLVGGKWTTYRSMAEETVDRAIEVCGLKPVRGCLTKGLLLHGAHGWTPTLFIRLIQDFGLDAGVSCLDYFVGLSLSWVECRVFRPVSGWVRLERGMTQSRFGVEHKWVSRTRIGCWTRDDSVQIVWWISLNRGWTIFATSCSIGMISEVTAADVQIINSTIHVVMLFWRHVVIGWFRWPNIWPTRTAIRQWKWRNSPSRRANSGRWLASDCTKTTPTLRLRWVARLGTVMMYIQHLIILLVICCNSADVSFYLLCYNIDCFLVLITFCYI